MNQPIDRRHALMLTGAASTSLCINASTHCHEGPSNSSPRPARPTFRYCLNTSTIAGQKLSLRDQVKIAATAGYDGIEPWIHHMRAYSEGVKPLADVGKQIADAGLSVECAIGFAKWIVDNDAERKQGLQDAERDMRLVRTIGGTRIAAPPVGASGPIDLDIIAERYRALLDLGAGMGVVPQLELWGHSPAIHRLGQLVYIATEAGHRDACMLPDVYHIYKGGSSFAGLRTIEGSRLHVFHMNDYPDDPPRDRIADRDRVYPGDGVAPIQQIVTDLTENGFAGAFSLELFNREYWKQDPLNVAKQGLRKMKHAIESAVPR